MKKYEKVLKVYDSMGLLLYCTNYNNCEKDDALESLATACKLHSVKTTVDYDNGISIVRWQWKKYTDGYTTEITLTQYREG